MRAGRDGARQDQRAVVKTAHFGQQRERAQRARVAARARAHQDQPVHARFQRFLGVAQRGDVVKDLAAPVVHALDQVSRRAQAGDDQRHAVAGAHGQVLFQAVVGLVDDLVDRERRHGGAGIRFAVRGKPGLDLVQPIGQEALRARVQRGERTHDAARALRDHQLRVGHDEHGGADDRQGHLAIQICHKRVGHSVVALCSGQSRKGVPRLGLEP
ncbi:hypothetical protein D3C72_1334410 [compost metagenome]